MRLELQPKNQRPAYVLRDVLVAIITLFCLAALTLPAISQVRIDSMRQGCLSNYRFIQGTTESYANDSAGKMWALSWKRGMRNPVFPFQYFSSDTEAQAYHAGLTLRRLANLTEAQSPIPTGWVAPLLYTPVALMDYVNLPAPASYLTCPADATRSAFLEGDFRRLFSGGDGSSINWRAVYSSSYQLGTSHWGPSRQTNVLNSFGATVKSPMWYPTSEDNSFWTVSGDTSAVDVFGPRNFSDVRFPSNKVFMWDEYARHNGKPRYHAYQTAGQDLLFYDGSVRYYRSDSTNPGWNPASASTRGNMRSRFSFTKKSDFFGTMDNNAAQATFAAGWYRWTRGGLYGWDVPRLSSMVGKLPSANVVKNEVDTSAATGTW